MSSVICIQSFIYLLYTFVTCSHVCMKCFRKEKEQQQDPDQLHSVLRTILQQVKVSCCIFGLEITLFSISFFESSYGHIKYCELSYYKTVPTIYFKILFCAMIMKYYTVDCAVCKVMFYAVIVNTCNVPYTMII